MYLLYVQIIHTIAFNHNNLRCKMKNIILYITTVFIWGSTWFAIEFQLGIVPVEVSIFYRFGLAAIIMWTYCLWKSIPLKLSMKDHGFMLLLALGNFSTNYAILYYAQNYLNSAMTSIAFSTLLLMNIVNTRVFFGKPIAARVYAGAIFGLLGIIALFWNDITAIDATDKTIYGLLLVLIGALVASLGNMVSFRNSQSQINVLVANAWGMLYGTLILGMWVVMNGQAFQFSFESSYILSLLYLAIFGSVIAFATYFHLLKNMGPEKASYLIVLFPVVAVILSSLFEGFVFKTHMILGFLLVIMGNVTVLTSKESFEKLIRRFR